MTQRRGTRDVVWIGLLMGLFALLCINVAVGITKGFGKPPGGPLLVLLAAPGMALGWGGVALLFVAIPYALLTWRHGKGPGSVLAVLGSVVFAFGVGGLAGVLTSPAAAAGGRLAGGLASLLRDGVGTAVAGLVLALIAVPGLLLALAPLLLETTGARAVTRAQGGKGPRAWYPERRLAPDGTELPPEFTGASDVGAIRVREPGDGPPPPPPPPTSTVTLSPPAIAGPAAKKTKPIAGIRYADEPLPDVGGPPPDAPRETRDDALPSGVRYAAPEAPPPAAAEAPPVEGVAQAEDAAAAAEVDLGPPQERPEGREARPVATSPAPASLAPAAPVSVAPPAVASPVVAPAEPAVRAPEPAAAALPPPAPFAALEQPVAGPPAATAPSPAPPMPPPTPAISAAAAVNEATRSSSAYRRKLDATGIVDGGAAVVAPTAAAAAIPATAPAPRPPPAASVAAAPAATAAGARPAAAPAKPRPSRPSRPRDLNEAIRGLFSSLPIEELPPVQPVIDPPEAPPAEPRVDPPGQRTLFDDATTPRAPGQRHPGTTDALFAPSVEAALERGSASLVLLKRKLGVGYARAASLMEALVEEGILGEMTASGSRPTLITMAEWSQRKAR